MMMILNFFLKIYTYFSRFGKSILNKTAKIKIEDSPKYEYYKRFCKSIDNGEWRIKKENNSRYSINGQGKVYVIINDKTQQQIWISNGYNSFCDYNYNRESDLITLDVFEDLKFFAWEKASKLIKEANTFNANFSKRKKALTLEKKNRAINQIITKKPV